MLSKNTFSFILSSKNLHLWCWDIISRTSEIKPAYHAAGLPGNSSFLPSLNSTRPQKVLCGTRWPNLSSSFQPADCLVLTGHHLQKKTPNMYPAGHVMKKKCGLSLV